MSKYQVDEIVNAADDGAPDFPKGLSTDGTNAFMYVPWTSYTPTFTGFGTVSSVGIQYRRVGDSVEIQGEFTAGTTIGTEAQITLPSSLTVSQTASGTVVVGVWLRAASTSGAYFVLATNGDTYLNVGDLRTDAGSDPTSPEDGNLVASTGNRVTFNAKVSILEWV